MSYKVTKAAAANAAESATQAPAFQTFEDLEVYQAARNFRKSIYSVTRKLPNFEKYDLGSQMRRASVSLTNNIAEGHGRFHYPDQIRFMLQSRGSLEELVDDLNVCLDEDYVPSAEIADLKQTAQGVLSLLNGYLRFLRKRSTSVRESASENSTADECAAALLDVTL
jgi:four helix bundle protein